MLIDDGASGNWIGINPSSGSDYALEVNTINSNTAAGVEISGLGTTGNVVAGSMMNANGTDGALIDNGASNNWIGLGPQEEPGGSLQGTSPFGSGMPLMGDVLNGDGNAGVEMSGQGTSGNVVAGDLINSNTSEGVLFDDGASGNWLGMNPADGTANDLTINNGGTVYPLTGNTLYGNDGFGVVFTGAGTSGNVVSGNVINVNAGGGVLINDAASNNFVGVNPVDTAEFGGTFWNVGPTQPQTGDIIYGNSVLGVEISGAGTSGNVIDGDGISNDGSYGVVIENGRVTELDRRQRRRRPRDAQQADQLSNDSVDGVEITGTGTTGNVVAGDYIGTNFTGTQAQPNGTTAIAVGDDDLNGGVLIDDGALGNLIGTSGQDGSDDVLERNVISGNHYTAVILSGADTTDNVVAGNYLGTTASGEAALGNGPGGDGVDIVNGASANWVGVNPVSGGPENADQGNLISGNSDGGAGVWIDPTSFGNVVAGNLIGADAAGTVAIGDEWGVYIQGYSNLVGTTGQNGGR